MRGLLALALITAFALRSLIVLGVPAEIAFLASLVTPAIILGSELVARELRHGHLVTMLRLPSGASYAFATKAALLILMIFACSALVEVFASVLATSLELDVTRARPWIAFDWLPWTLAACGIGLWCFGVGTWMRRASMAVPLAFLTLLALFAFFAYGHMKDAWFHPDGIERWLLLACALPAAGIAVTLASLRGLRLLDEPLRSASLGGTAALVACVAFYSWQSARAAAWHSVRGADPSIIIGNCWLSAGERKVWLSVGRHGSPMYGLCVDLESGEQRDLGAECQVGGPGGTKGHSPLMGTGARLVRAFDYSSGPAARERFFDADTGELVHTRWIKSPRLNPPLYKKLVQPLRDNLRETTPYRLSDGRRYWYLEAWEVEDGDAHRKLRGLEGEGGHVVPRLGYIWLSQTRRVGPAKFPRHVTHSRLYDPETESMLPPKALPRIARRVGRNWVAREGARWVVIEAGAKGKRALRALRPAGQWFLGAAIDSERVFVLRIRRAGGKASTTVGGILNVSRDELEPVEIAESDHLPFNGGSDAGPMGQPCWDQKGRRILREYIQHRGSGRVQAVLLREVSRGRFESFALPDSVRPVVVGTLGDDLLVVDVKRLLRVSFEKRSVTQIWPLEAREL